MTDLQELVNEFLGLRRIAVAGVSRFDTAGAANAIFRKLRKSGYEVFPVNPRAEVVENSTCYPDLKSVPGGVSGVVIVTPPEATERLVRECAEAGVKYVWMHRSFGAGSVSQKAIEFCRGHGIAVIGGGCPMMFSEPVDFPHKCVRWILWVTGGLPQGGEGVQRAG